MELINSLLVVNDNSMVRADGIRERDMLKAGGEIVVRILTEIFKDIIQSG